jgi:hypothetical protein
LSSRHPSRLVAIHQPNFFPWLGYFDKIAQSDFFVFLDEVNFPKHSWVNRVRLNIQHEARWTTCPVRRATWRGSIAGVEIDDDKPWRDKLLKTLDANYRRAARFTETMALIEPLIRSNVTRLADFNISAVTAIARELRIATTLLRQTELPHAGASNDLLASLVKAAGGDTYLIGGGADDYHDVTKFEAAGLRVLRQDFVHSPYGPTGHFIPGVSVIDYLMHDGRPLGSARRPECT